LAELKFMSTEALVLKALAEILSCAGNSFGHGREERQGLIEELHSRASSMCESGHENCDA
jgi:hypothetical protein